MKKIVVAVVLTVAAVTEYIPPLYTADLPQTQIVPAVTTVTFQTVAVDTNTKLMLSTGTFVMDRWPQPGASLDILNRSTYTYDGTRMNGRTQMEIVNDSDYDIYIGGPSVSSQTNTSRGRRIPKSGGTWSYDGDFKELWAVAEASTGYKISITQGK